MNTSPNFATIDVRSIPPGERHPLIFSTFRSLATGQSMELVNDHDPRPLHAQFMTELPSAFTWHRIEAGPETWRVRITKLDAPATASGCCGRCGGG